MKIIRATSFVLLLGAVGQAAGRAPPSLPRNNPALLQDFADALLVRHRTGYAFDSFVSEHLVQHNPAAKDGRAAAIGLVGPIVAAPGAQFAVSTLIVDGDFAFLHYRGTLDGAGHAAAFAELYRIEHGTFVEHWDAFQSIPAKPVSPHPMFGTLSASLPAPCTGASPQDRAVVLGFADLLYRQRNVRSAFERYASPTMIQHDPRLPDGRDPAVAELAPILSRPATHITIAHVLACHGMGVIHLRSRFGEGPGHMIFDIMRIDRGRIVEHWDVFQPIQPGVNPRSPI
jgi:predicted SnoaL-like aldol condensation-catalyzing enzyme